jgi:putative ABC transport system substrate-binding protein
LRTAGAADEWCSTVAGVKYVHRILTGTSPQNLPVESFSRIGLAVNARTARELGIAIPQSLLLRADEMIQ